MAIRRLYFDSAGISGPISASINTSHASANATATILCENTTLDIGDSIEVDLGYTDEHSKVFEGYVKQIDRKTPDNVYTITAHDLLVRASDYFVISSTPDEPYNFGKGISAENLVGEVLGLAGLGIDILPAPSLFVFGNNNDVEVNLVSAYDYCKMIADLLTWSLWCDEDGLIHFANRKPFPMTSSEAQPGWVNDTAINPTDPIVDTICVELSKKRTEKDLRNKVVVWGSTGITYTASQSTSYDPFTGTYHQILPADYYKSVVCSYGFIDNNTLAKDIGDYNLYLLNRVQEQLSVTMLGNPNYLARKAVNLQSNKLSIAESLWYIYSSELSWSRAGFLNNLELRR